MDQAQNLRALMQDEGQADSDRARVIAVTSGKGGVGKSNISVSLALAAAAMDRDVIILDADLGLANIDVILDVQAPYNLHDVMLGKISVEDALVPARGGVRILPGATGISSVADLTTPEQGLFLENIDRLERQTDLIIVDTGAGISSRVVNFCVASGEVIVVTTPEPTAITDAYAMIKVLKDAKPDLDVWLLVNIAGNRGEGEQILDRIILLSDRFMSAQVRRAGIVLSDPRVSLAVRRRQPFFLAYPSCPATVCIHEIARTLGLEDPRKRGSNGFFSRMTSLIRGHLGVAVGDRS